MSQTPDRSGLVPIGVDGKPLVPPPAERSPVAKPRHWLAAAVARGIALWFGAFTLVSLVGELRTPAFDANIWWVDLRQLPGVVALSLYCAVGVALVAYAVAPRMRPWRFWPTFVLMLGFAAVAAWNSAHFYLEWRSGHIRPGVPFPLSLVICAAFVYLAWAALRAPAPGRRRITATAVLVAVVAALVIAFPLAQFYFFGETDCRRQADVAVVFGAEVHNNGLPSTSLTDRVNTAVALYKEGLVKRLFVSGGVGTSGYNEAIVMRNMAIKRGVPAERIAVDSNGVNTNATVADTVPFFGGDGWRRIIVVSQFYHLPRIKLAYERAGWNVITVPAGTSVPIPQTPRLVLREIPAFWVYYLKAVV
jgi:vancomycin permeability regulator SanA